MWTFRVTDQGGNPCLRLLSAAARCGGFTARAGLDCVKHDHERGTHQCHRRNREHDAPPRTPARCGRVAAGGVACDERACRHRRGGGFQAGPGGWSLPLGLGPGSGRRRRRRRGRGVRLREAGPVFDPRESSGPLPAWTIALLRGGYREHQETRDQDTDPKQAHGRSSAVKWELTDFAMHRIPSVCRTSTWSRGHSQANSPSASRCGCSSSRPLCAPAPPAWRPACR